METIQVAENDALKLTERNWGLLFDCATRSYPFGPGDGCWCFRELDCGVTCRTGSGCVSGWGRLARADARIRRFLLPLLRSFCHE